MTNDNQIAIVCPYLDDPADLAYLLPGSRADHCCECESLIAVSPSAQEFTQKNTSDGYTVLLFCDGCIRRKPADDVQLEGLVPGIASTLTHAGYDVDALLRRRGWAK